MKLLVEGFLLIVLLFTKTATSQTIKIAKSKVLDYKSLKYIGSNSMYNFFSAVKEDKNYLIKVDTDDINEIEEERIQLRETEIAEIFMSDSHIFYITYTGTPSKFFNTTTGLQQTESTVTAINFYQYNSYTDDLLAKEKIPFEEEKNARRFGALVSVNLEKHFICVGLTDYYDFNFKPIKNIALYKNAQNTVEKAFKISPKKERGFGLKPNFKDYKKEAATTPKILNTNSYSIQYNENTDNAVAVFKMNLTDVKILGNNGKEIKQKFQLPDSKIIIDLYASTTPDNSLILLGKYCEQKDDKIIYGFFTTKYNFNLSVTMDIVYTPVIETDKKQKNLDKQPFVNLFFVTSYYGFNHELIGNQTQFYFYQFWDTKIRGIVNYEVIAEDIYAIMIDSSGVVKMRKHPLNQNSRLLGYCRPLLVSNQKDYYLIYFDHKANITPVGNKPPSECDLIVTTTVMAGHKIDVKNAEIEAKKLLFNCNDAQFIPETTNMKAATDGAFINKMVYLVYSNGIIYQLTVE